MIIVCTSKSGASYHGIGTRGGYTGRFEYGQMADSGSHYLKDDTVHKLIDLEGCAFIKLGSHWRPASELEIDLYHHKVRNLITMLKLNEL